MSDNRNVAAGVIAKAAKTIISDRPGVHGSAENSFVMIGEMWTTYLKHTRRVTGSILVRPQDVAHMMAILKKCRALYGDQTNEDNFVDDVGYSALAGMLQLPDPDASMEDQLGETFDRTVDGSDRPEVPPVQHTNIDDRPLSERVKKTYEAPTLEKVVAEEKIDA